MVSNKSEFLIKEVAKGLSSGEQKIVSRDAFPRTTTAKDIAFYCFNSNILFMHTVNKYYFKKPKETQNER